MIPKEVHVFTSAAFNYLPKARMLFRSLRNFHPSWKLYLALPDELPKGFDLSGEPFDEILPLCDLGIDNWLGWSFCHTITELATAIKPFAMRHILANSADDSIILYLDPDMEIYSGLDDILQALEEASIALTPHQVQPESSLTDIISNEITISLKHGVYSLGFIGVSKGSVADAFTAWWCERAYFFCRDNTANGLFTDQRWIDLLPSFFPNVAIMRTPRHNVAPWNLTTRRLTVDSEGSYFVNDEPLGIYHFTGFDSGSHDRKSERLLAANPGLTPLLTSYKQRLKQDVDLIRGLPAWSYGFFSDGTPINNDQRLIYRMRKDLQLAYSNPYDDRGFLSWWRREAPKQYAALFNHETASLYRASILSNLTPGFIGNQEKYEQERIDLRKLFDRMRADPSLGLSLAKRGWEIIKRNGPAGIAKMLKG
jgi:hypothetical protein